MRRVDILRFNEACNKIMGKERERKGIGTLGERTLHAVLKEYYEPDNSSHEIKIGRYFADIVGENGIIEIQTRQLSKLVPKLKCFLEVCHTTVVYLVAKVKYVRWLDEETGEISKRRKSPTSYNEFSVFYDIYPLRNFITDPNFHLIICFLEIEDIRSLNGWSENKKRGSSRYDRIPISILEEISLFSVEDYKKYLPKLKTEDFTSLEYAKEFNISRSIARSVLGVLESTGLVKRTGKTGNNILFSVVSRV